MRFQIIFLNKYIFFRIVDNELIIIIFYIDNILVFIKIQLLINEIKRDIKKIFKIKNSNFVKRIFNIQIYRD